jgi:hypothetical protein
MTEKHTKQGVPLWAFVDDQDAEFLGNQWDIATMTLEQVVDKYAHQERRRSRDAKPEGRSEIPAHGTTWPSQVVDSLSVFSAHTAANRSLATLTKCGSYPIAYWYACVLKLDDIATLYEAVDLTGRQIQNLFLNSTFLEQLNIQQFPCPEPETKEKTLYLISWFKSKAVRYAKALGMAYPILVGIGYEWWLTTTEQAHLDPTNITQRYWRDARLLEVFCHERLSQLRYLENVAKGRYSFVIDVPKIESGRVITGRET